MLLGVFQAQSAVYDIVIDMNARQALSDSRVCNIEEDLRRLQVLIIICIVPRFRWAKPGF